jgi:hypothetical protein
VTHCKVCGLKETHPGIAIDADGTCNLCRLEVPPAAIHNLAALRERFDEFRSAPPNPHADHDCLLMYSGGKDSTYALTNVVDELGKRVLAYTFDVPYQSADALDNMRRARDRLDATFVVDGDESIVEVMRSVFTRPPPASTRYLDEKLPCIACRSFFLIKAILYAAERRIPYVLLCADPQQTLTMEWRTPEIVRELSRAAGSKATDAALGDALDELLFRDPEELPKVVFPFVADGVEYEPEQMAAEMAERGVYRSSPFETHCNLLPLLNHYSFRHWGSMFYKLNASSHVRATRRAGGPVRATYSVRFADGFDVVAVEDELAEVTRQLVDGGCDRADAEKRLREVFKRLGASDEAAATVARNYADLRAIAADIGVPLEPARA